MKSKKNKRIYLSPPHMSDIEKKLLIEAFDSNWIAPIGPSLNQFEKEMSNFLGGYYTAALSSGTAALHLALRILNIKEGDNVLCPSLTFAATANAVVYEKANPVFIDVNKNNGLINSNLLEDSIKKYKPKAIITVDLYGHSCNYNEIIDLCSKYNVYLIEDAAEALGSTYKNRKCGTFGAIGVFSFNGNKIITTSSGGMLISNNEEYIKKAKYLSTQAREDFLHYEHKELGYNYRMSNLLAAIGIGQLKRIDDLVCKRRKIYKRYFKNLSKIEGFSFTKELSNEKSNRWLTSMIIDPSVTGVTKKLIIKKLESNNIESRPIWKPMHLQPFYNSAEYITDGKEDISAKLFKNGLCLPSGSSLIEKNQNKIIDIISSLVK